MLSDMLSKRARFGEPLEDYFYEKTILLNRCNIHGKDAVDCIIYGIDDRIVRMGAEAAQYEDPNKLLSFLRNAKVTKAISLFVRLFVQVKKISLVNYITVHWAHTELF